MLNFIRERAQGWVAWFIVGLITIPFALWGVNSYFNGPTDVITATVNGEPIKQADLQRALQQYRERMRASMGEQFDPELFEGTAAKKQILEGLIQQKLLQQTNSDLNQYITDAIVTNLIKSTPAFQTDGEFDSERYRLLLVRMGLQPIKYELDLKRDILIQELTENIQKSALVTQKEIDNLLRLEKQERKISFGVLSVDSMLDDVTVTDGEIRAYFEKHTSKYVAPERVSINYIELSTDELAKSIEVSTEKLESFYKNNQSQFLVPEQRRASHILIEGDDNAALMTMTDIEKKLKAGADFKALAKTYSADSGSAQEGGDLGFFQRNVMVSEFSDAVFGLASIGDISDPIKTEFGYHLIKLTGIKKPESQTFSDVKDDIEQAYRNQKAEELFYEYAEQLADLSYENPDSLDAAAEGLSLEIKHTEAFTRDGGKGVIANKKVVDVAFSEDVLVNNLNSAVIEISKTDLVVIHKKQYTPSSLLPFESVAPAITEQLRFDKARDKAQIEGEQRLASLRLGSHTPTTLFKPDEWHDTKSYGRLSDEISNQVLQRAFSLPKPTSADESYWSGFSAANGNYIILNVSAVEEGDAGTATTDEREGLLDYVERTYGQSELNAFIQMLKRDADIEIITQNLK